MHALMLSRLASGCHRAQNTVSTFVLDDDEFKIEHCVVLTRNQQSGVNGTARLFF